MTALSFPLSLDMGYWEPRVVWFARQDVTPSLAEAFVDLGWFDAELEAG